MCNWFIITITSIWSIQHQTDYQSSWSICASGHKSRYGNSVFMLQSVSGVATNDWQLCGAMPVQGQRRYMGPLTYTMPKTFHECSIRDKVDQFMTLIPACWKKGLCGQAFFCRINSGILSVADDVTKLTGGLEAVRAHFNNNHVTPKVGVDCPQNYDPAASKTISHVYTNISLVLISSSVNTYTAFPKETQNRDSSENTTLRHKEVAA